MRVILEIGKKRRVVAGAMDWPGSTAGARARRRRSSGCRRTARATRASPSGPAWRASSRGSGDVEVVERVPGSSSTDFWGIAHVPSLIEDEVLPSAELERRLTLLARVLGLLRRRRRQRVTGELLPSGRTYGRTPRADRPTRVHQRARAVLAQGRGPHGPRRRHDARRPGGPPGGVPRRDPRLQRGGQAGPDVADPVPDPPDGPARDGPRVGARGPRSAPRRPRRRRSSAPASGRGPPSPRRGRACATRSGG